MDDNLILKNYDPLAKRTTFPTTSFLDGATQNKERDCEGKGSNHIQIERDRHRASVPRAVLLFL